MGKRAIEKLNPRTVATIKEPGRHSDGGGLYLAIDKDGRRRWVFMYTRSGKRREMGLGATHTVSLAEARKDALDARKQIHNGLDPLAERRREAAERSGAMSFKECADAFLGAHKASWRNPKHRAQWESTLKAYAYPAFGALPVGEVDTAHVMKVIEPLWAEKTETASRLRGRIERVLDWAKARGYRQGENPARWRGHLDKLLPARSKVQRVKHHAALPWAELPPFMASLRERSEIGARALEFAILTGARSGEVRGATWEEFDTDARAWTIPAERMKAGREHRVPLSDRALAILEAMKAHGRSGFAFPGARRGSPLSDATLGAVLKRMGRGDLTAHGFRSTFRDWAAEATAYPREVCEQALAHTLKDKVEAAYRRGDLYEKRRRLMADWAAYCARPAPAGEVVAIRRSAT